MTDTETLTVVPEPEPPATLKLMFGLKSLWIDAGGKIVADMTDVPNAVHGHTRDECEAIGRRMVAAWNACEGLSTEKLEAMSQDWQPISTAPEGPEIDVWRKDAGVFSALFYVPHTPAGELDGFWCSTYGGEDLIDDMPTLWRPKWTPPEPSEIIRKELE